LAKFLHQVTRWKWNSAQLVAAIVPRRQAKTAPAPTFVDTYPEARPLTAPPGTIKLSNELRKCDFSVYDAQRVNVGLEKRIGKNRYNVPSHYDFCPRVGLLHSRASGESRWNVNRMHAADADDIRLKLRHLPLQWNCEPLVSDSNQVSCRFQSRGYVFEPQGFDSEERT